MMSVMWYNNSIVLGKGLYHQLRDGMAHATIHDTTAVPQDAAATRTNSKMLPQTNIRPDKFDFLLYQDGK